MNPSSVPALTVYDYVVFGLMLLISAGIGFYYYLTGGRQKTAKEYLLGNSEMGVLRVAVSLMASFMSAITLMGVPAENYYYSTQFVAINISYIIATPICLYVFLPVFFVTKCASSYEYLERRFNAYVRTAASVVFVVQMVLYMGIVLYAPALALSAVTGISKWWSIIAVGVVCTLYCTTGGIKAVLSTDVFQSVLMFIVMAVILVKGTLEVGGVATVWKRAVDGNRIQFYNLDLDPTARHTFWSLAIGGIFIYTSIYGINQTQVQRLLTVSSLRKAQQALLLSWPVTSILSILTCSCGIVMYAYYYRCDPILHGTVKQHDQLLPLFAMQILSALPGLPGLFVAGIFAGALSSVSSFVNSLAAVTLEDYLKPLCYKNRTLDERKAAFICKLFACFYGLICLAVAYMAEKVSGILQASLSIFGIVGGPLLALYTLGMCTKYCTSTAALTSFILSLIFGLWMSFGALLVGPKPRPLGLSLEDCLGPSLNQTYLPFVNSTASLPTGSESFYVYRISYMWYGALTWLVSIVVASLVSLLPQSGPKKDVKPELLSPVYHYFFSRDTRDVELIEIDAVVDPKI